jgi:hypothetical protein
MKEVCFTFACTLMILSGLAGTPAISITDNQFSPAATGISLTIGFGNGTLQEFSNLNGTNVYEVTSSVTAVQAEWYGDLVYVTSISGVAENVTANLYWQYWVDGKLGGSAANKYILSDGDSIEWKLPSQIPQSSTTTDFQIDTSLIIGGSILGLVTISVLIVLWLKQQKG